MKIKKSEFEKMVFAAMDNLPEKFVEKINNLAVFIEDYPSKKQRQELNIKNNYDLLGLFEGYSQAGKLDFGPVLPDRITIFRQPILSQCATKEEIEKLIISTLKHEIAHHFGSEESGAEKASKK